MSVSLENTIEVWSSKDDHKLDKGDVFDTLSVKSLNKKRAKAIFLVWALLIAPTICYAMISSGAKQAYFGGPFVSICIGGFLYILVPAYVERFKFRDRCISWSTSARKPPQDWYWRDIRAVEDKQNRVELTLKTGTRVGCAYHATDEARARVMEQIESRRKAHELTSGQITLGKSCTKCGGEMSTSGECPCSVTKLGELSTHESLNFTREAEMSNGCSSLTFCNQTS